MKTYELFTIIKPNIDSEEVDKETVKIENLVKSYGGEVLNVDKQGRKKLAYDIQKFRDGYFVVSKLQIPEEKVIEFKRQLRLNESFLRIMFMNVQKVGA